MAEKKKASPKPKATEQRNVKEFWRDVLEENLDDVRARLIEATGATKEGWVTCKNCNHRVSVPIPDARARTDAAKALHELAGEKPLGAGKGGTAPGGIILRRVLVMPTGEERILSASGLTPEQEL